MALILRNYSSDNILQILLLFLLSSCVTPSVLVTQEQQKGDYYNNQHDYEQALIHYQNCLSASAKLGSFRNLDMEADVLRKVAHVYSVLGKFDEALSVTFLALSRDSIQNNVLETIEDYRMLGSISLYKGDFKKGSLYLEHALELNDGMETTLKGTNRLSIADTYLSLAQLYTVLGRFDQCIEYSKSALNIYVNLNDKKGLMEGNLILGNTFLNLGMSAEARQYIEHSLNLARELDLSLARHYQSLGEIFSSMSDFEQAIRYKLNALDEAEKSGIIPQIVWSRIGVGDAYADIGDNAKATGYFQSATEIQDNGKMTALAMQASADLRLGNISQAQQYFMEIDAGVASGIASMRLGEINYESGDIADALREYEGAINYFNKAGIQEGMAKGNLRLGDIYINQGDIQDGDRCLTEAFRYAKEDETKWEIWYQKGRVFEITHQTDSAIESYKKAIGIIEEIRGKFTIEEYKSKYINNKVKVYDRLIRILLEKGDATSALIYSERARARAFLDMIGNRKLQIKITPDKNLVDLEQDLRLRIQSLSKIIQKNDLGTSRGLERYQVEEELVHSREQYNTLLEKIKLSNREYASMVSIEPPDPGETRNILDKETALISYWTGEDYLAIWVITAGDIKFNMHILPDKNVSTASVTASRQAIQKTTEFRGMTNDERGLRTFTTQAGENVTEKELLKRDYSLLIAPVEKYLAGYTNIGIIPHGSLHFLPFQAMICPDGKFLVEKYNIFYTPSASIYSFIKEKSGKPEKHIIAMALGNLELGDFSSLPGTTSEVDQIRKLYSDITSLYESESTETFLKTNASAYEYIHIATHGVLDPVQPLYSYLLFAPSENDDGLLTVNEVFGLDLKASLVTLSACQTGLGNLSLGDDIVGLSRAFLFAGTPAVIVSLWSVADQPTAVLMTKFYQNLENFSPQEALSRAQREVMKQYPDPYYWAPFQLIKRGN